MLEEIFDIEKFKIYSDDNYYYFFRALEELDIEGIKSGQIVDENGNLTKLITDREFYGINDRYDENSNISLEEIFNHIKMHYSKDTNCISFSSNANVALTYGRKDYEYQYITIKVPKEEMGNIVYNAGLYMMQELTKKVNDAVENEKLDELQRYYLRAINEAKTQEALDRIKETFPKEYVETDLLERGISFPFESTKTIQYQSLNDEQNLEKNKLVLKIDVINKNIIPNISNNFLIQTLGNAFSSLEIIHYKDVDGKKIIKTPKEIMDVLGLLQQVGNYEYLDEIKQIITSKLGQNIDIPDFKYEDYETAA